MKKNYFTLDVFLGSNAQRGDIAGWPDPKRGLLRKFNNMER